MSDSTINDDLQPHGVPSGGDSLSEEQPTSNDGTADADAVSGDAGAADDDLTVNDA